MTTGSGKPSEKTRKQFEELRAFALAFPATREDHPWGHSAFKVREKVFVFLTADERGLGFSAKLVESNLAALDLPNTEPTGYGLGKHGWVSGMFAPNERVPMEQVKAWIEESFRAIAPKKLVREFDESRGGGASDDSEKQVKTSMKTSIDMSVKVSMTTPKGAPEERAKKKAAKKTAKKTSKKAVAKKPVPKKPVPKKTATKRK